MSLTRSFSIRRSLGLGMFLAAAIAVPAQADVKSALDALNAKKYNKAAEELSKAFEAGEPDAAFYLGRMLELGLGGKPNLQAAVGLYIAGSAKKSAASKNRLGVLHIQGKGVLQDYEQGAKLICDAAELGDVNGAYNCGSILRDGKGVKKDEQKAVEWFKQASGKGHLGAKNLYANALVEGKYLKRDIKSAIGLYQQTAALGNPVGLFSLAQAFATGLGLDKDLVKAHAYFNIASALNHPQAAAARQTIEKSMNSGQVLKAQQLAKSWRPSPQKGQAGVPTN